MLIYKNTGILAYANAINYKNAKVGDVIELVKEDAELMDSIIRKRCGTLAIIKEKIDNDMLVEIIIDKSKPRPVIIKKHKFYPDSAFCPTCESFIGAFVDKKEKCINCGQILKYKED